MRAATAFAAILLLAGVAWLGPRTLPAAKLRWDLWRSSNDPDELYRLAERLYQAGDNEKAEVFSEKALRRKPAHAPAQALLLEVRFILGRGPPSPPGTYTLCNLGVASSTQTLLELDAAFERADRALTAGDLESAERELRKILEVAKRMPTGVEVAARTMRAADWLGTLHARRCAR